MNRTARQAAVGMLSALLVITNSLAAGAQDSRSRAATCAAPTKPVDISIRTPSGRVVYNTGVSRSDMIRIQRSRSRGSLNGNWKPLGLTLSSFQFSIATSVNLRPIAGDKFCVYPSAFKISVGYAAFKVYIDRRYGRGSCEYRAVLNHENSHVSLFRGYLSRNKAQLQRAVYAAARRITPIVVTDPNQGVRYVRRQMQMKLKPIVDRINRGADRANARIDTITSYRRIQARCRNW